MEIFSILTQVLIPVILGIVMGLGMRIMETLGMMMPHM